MTHVPGVLSLLVVSIPALADEAAIRWMMQEKLHAGGEVESVQKAPFGDLYEVVIRAPGGALVYYVDSRATVIIAGQVMDAKTDAFDTPRQHQDERASTPAKPGDERELAGSRRLPARLLHQAYGGSACPKARRTLT